MIERQRKSRREFLCESALGTAIASALAGGLWSCERERARAAGAQTGPLCPPLGALDPQTYVTMSHFAEQIVPTDDQPGGMHSCLASFIEAVALGDPSFGDYVTLGASALDDSSRALFSASFAELAFDDQTGVLLQVEANGAPGEIWPNLGAGGQAAWFGAMRTLIKVAYVNNWPEASVRDSGSGVPLFADAEHLISDPNVPGSGTGWDAMQFHAIDWEVEQLLWAWHAGARVIGFDGGPIIDESQPLSDAERLTARAALYLLSSEGRA